MLPSIFQPRITVIAHNGEFHADDVFAVAALKMFLDNKGNVFVIRTRDTTIIEKSRKGKVNRTYVVDVGGVYDPVQQRFDHHQAGGAGKRENGIPYASFGLVWKEYGEKICNAGANSGQVASMIDQKIVQPIDASDNGVSIYTEKFSGVRPYSISSLIGGMNPDWNEKISSLDQDERFLVAVALAQDILSKEIQSAKSELEGEQLAREAYEKSSDKRVIILGQNYPYERLYMQFPEPLFVIYPKDSVWRLKAIKKSNDSFENRKDLPAAWAGKTGAELEQISGVSGALFCHNKLFMAAAKTREAAVALAEIALK